MLKCLANFSKVEEFKGFFRRATKMLTPNQALAKILETVRRRDPEERPLEKAVFLAAAQDIVAPESYPFFSSSAMDGYAVRVADLKGASPELPVSLPLAGELKAGSCEKVFLPQGKTMSIMTGGALPEGADSVVKREDVKEEKDSVTFFAVPQEGSFINLAGGEIEKGKVLIEKGKALNPSSLGLLAAFGINRVAVFPPPSVSLITTGDELIDPGIERKYGQVYDSVTPMLRAALNKAGVEKVSCLRARDNPEELFDNLSRALEDSSLVITVGGVSVGKYDYLGRVTEKTGVEKIFWKVAQKPGKPLLFGRKEEKLFFGLPGNPGSALVSFLLYVLPAVRKIMGYKEPGPLWRIGYLAGPLENKEPRTFFMRGRAEDDGRGGFFLEDAGEQDSYMLYSFAGSNALVEIPPGPVKLEAGDKVRFLTHFWEV